MTEKKKNLIKKTYTSIGVVALIGVVHTSGVVRARFEDNTKTCNEDVPEVKIAVIKIEESIKTLTTSVDSLKDGQEELTTAINKAFPIYSQNQRLLNDFQEITKFASNHSKTNKSEVL